jgi:lysophospholipase L1-like esterase
MARTIYEQEAAAGTVTFAYTGSFTAAATSDAKASGGSYRKATATGTCTISIASSSGITGILVLCHRMGRGTTAGSSSATVTVDGVLQADNWDQTIFTTQAAATFVSSGVTYDTIWNRSAYRPIYFSNPAAAHTIVITWTVGTVTVDAVEAYIADSAVVGRVTAFGHSIVAGSAAGLLPTQRYTRLVATAIGGTEDNHGVGGETLINKTATIPSIGWQRAEDLGAGATIGAVTLSGGTIASVATGSAGSGYNDMGPWVQVADSAGINGIVQAVTSGGAVASWRVQNPGSGYVSPTLTLMGQWHMRTPDVAIWQHGINDASQWFAVDPNLTGTLFLPWSSELYKQRTREAFWRMNLNSPNTRIVALGSTNVYSSPATTEQNGPALYQPWGNLLATVCSETTVSRARFIDPYNLFIQGGSWANLMVLEAGIYIHPNAAGNALIAREVVRALGELGRVASGGRSSGVL